MYYVHPFQRVVVVGLGNVLVGDDALGPWVVRTLEARYELDPAITVIEGTPGNDLVPHLMDADAVIVVDTVRTEGRPGQLRRYRRETLLRTPPPARLNPHQPGLKEALLSLDLTGAGPGEVLLIGVIPDVVETGVGLSPVVRDAAERALEELVLELDAIGVPPVPRAEPRVPDLWWERGAASPIAASAEAAAGG
jgi:hydrogenase maturation protease